MSREDYDRLIKAGRAYKSAVRSNGSLYACPRATAVALEELRVAALALLPPDPPKPPSCPVYAELCPEHEFHHGAEAEELRAGMEDLIAANENSVDSMEIQRLLDRVNARDSLAYLEAHDDFDDEPTHVRQ